MEELIETIVRRMLKEQSFVALVKSVDKDNDTCVVEIEETGVVVEDVRLKSIVDEVATKVVAYPELDSLVICALLHNDENEAYIARYSAIEQIVVDCDDVLINGGQNSGLVIAPTLVAELDKTKAVVDAIKSTLTGWTVLPGDGGAALKTAIAAALTGKSTGDYSDIENDKVKH